MITLADRSGLRTRTAAETFEIARRFFGELGISRVTDITRLDTLDLPVFVSIRPRGESLRVHAGKGVCSDQARTGAAMEAIEFAVAEPQRTTWRSEILSAAELSAQLGHGLRLLDLRPRIGIVVDPADRIPAVACRDLSSLSDVYLPAQIVFFPLSAQPYADFFGGTTNGLASGNSLDEATLHAVLEVLERDAVAMNTVQDESEWIPAHTFPVPFRHLALRWKASGVELGVRSIPNAFGLPCFEARLHETTSDDVNLAGGFGLHLDRSIAFNRAVCEAAQSRLGQIHGGRDDVTRFYEKYTAWLPSFRTQTEKAVIGRFNDSNKVRDFTDIPTVNVSSDAIASSIVKLTTLLKARGFPAVFRYSFHAALDGLHVVRVVVPRCEHLEINQKRIGQRLLDRVLARA